ncbi:PAS domain-containing protein [Microvirga sp. CF3016]|uniref:PAS domain-containing protein n=1 Tax=Microvirga sp. CF3016 TaxID=3110181 RepID=UPI002E787F8E|nr:PAS domain-containing protein [Microvirga sp. CF3016]MEE1611912.1 PAS domain-containing protein [Microvirga sp. CF3016]
MNHEQPGAALEHSPDQPKTSVDELVYRLRQQELLAAFGRLALETPDFRSLLQEATQLCAEGLNTRFCKIMEYLPDEEQFIVRVGVGWKPGVIGSKTGADLDSPTGNAFQTGKSVISSHLEHEGRFRTPQILMEHGIRRAINVPIITPRSRYGILEVDSPVESRFTEADIAFMQGFANLLGVALERRTGEAALHETEERYRLAARATNDVIWDWDLRADRILWNEAVTKLFGYAKTETDGSWWKDHIHPSDSERVIESMQSAIASAHETWSAEYRFLRADGSEAYVFDRGFVIRDDQGRVIRMIGSMLDLTERRQAEARLAGIFAQASVGLSEVSLDGRALQVNDELCRMLGRSREELLGLGITDVTHPDDLPATLTAVTRVLETGEPASIDKRYLRPDGAVVWANSRVTRLDGTQGEPTRLLVVTIDLTARRQAEADLRESEARFQAIANSIDQMVWSTRPDGYHDFFNQRWYDYTGVPQGSTDGSAWAGIFHPDDQERAWGTWRHCLATGEPYHIEYRLRHRSGQYRWVLGRAQPVRDEAGRITRWFGTCTDIQEIVEAREVLTRSREELEREIAERTEERDRIWQNSNELMGVFGFDGGRRAINPSWSRVLGYDEEWLLNTPMMEITHPDDRPRLAVAIEGLARGERLVDFEDRLRHVDGSYRTISWTGVPGDGVFYGIGRDVTEHRRAEEALRQAQKMEAVGQLTGGVAHDFNNLLTIVRSSVDFLRRPNLPEERRIRYIDAISDTVDRAAKLTGQLLAFARRQALKPEVFEVPERIRAISDMLHTIVGSRIRIVTNIACERCFVEADVTQFETALVNMAVNARDAMNGEGTLRVHVESLSRMPSLRGHAGGRGRFVAVSISDTGSGIPPDRLSHIFEPFFTTKEVGKGTGLGLSQVYGFAKQSGGDVAVESTVGQGTTFTLYLPRTERGIAADAEDSGRGTDPNEEGRGCRVLVVEDNLEVGRFSTQLLQDLGYETTWAANASEALTLLEEDASRFDVVFSDVVMPGMSGVELGREIRQRYPRLPVVLTSGYSHVLAEEGRHGFELLHKPYAVEDVSRVLRRMTRGPVPSHSPGSGTGDRS